MGEVFSSEIALTGGSVRKTGNQRLGCRWRVRARRLRQETQTSRYFTVFPFFLINVLKSHDLCSFSKIRIISVVPISWVEMELRLKHDVSLNTSKMSVEGLECLRLVLRRKTFILSTCSSPYLQELESSSFFTALLTAMSNFAASETEQIKHYFGVPCHRQYPYVLKSRQKCTPLDFLIWARAAPQTTLWRWPTDLYPRKVLQPHNSVPYSPLEDHFGPRQIDSLNHYTYSTMGTKGWRKMCKISGNTKSPPKLENSVPSSTSAQRETLKTRKNWICSWMKIDLIRLNLYGALHLSGDPGTLIEKFLWEEIIRLDWHRKIPDIVYIFVSQVQYFLSDFRFFFPSLWKATWDHFIMGLIKKSHVCYCASVWSELPIWP